MALHRENPNAHNRRVLTQGETLRLRRKRLGWTVREAVKKAGIGKDALISLEHDRGSHTSKLAAYKIALERAEQVSGPPDLTSPVTAAVPTGVDVLEQKIRAARVRLGVVEDVLRAALADVEKISAELADEVGQQRKSG